MSTQCPSSEFEAELAEIVGEWLTDNKAQLEDGGSGDVLSLARQIERLSRMRAVPV